MEDNKEFQLLREICKDNENKFYLVSDLLEIQRSKALMNRKRGLNDEIESKVESYIKKKAHPTFRVMRQSCSAYSLSLKYLSSLKPYALRFITFILLFIPSTLAVEI